MPTNPNGIKFIIEREGDTGENRSKAKHQGMVGLDVFFLAVLLLGGANWGVTALRMLTDRHRVQPHDALSWAPWGVQFSVYLLVFAVTIYFIIHLGYFRIEYADFNAFDGEERKFLL